MEPDDVLQYRHYMVAVPLCCTSGVPYNPATFIDLEKYLCAFFGGFTSTEGTGGWQASSDSGILREKVRVYHCFSEDDRLNELKTIYATLFLDQEEPGVYMTGPF